MTAWPETACPACLAESSAPLAAGGRLCLSCRHEWDPATTTGPLAEAPATQNPPGVHLVEPGWSPPVLVDLATELDRARDLYVGQQVVVYEYEVNGTCTDITDDGIAVIDIGDGFIVHAEAQDFTLAEVDALPTPEIVELGAVDLTVAAKVIESAIATFVGEGDNRTLGIPPNGWLPRDVEAWPIVEHGASYAVAIIANIYGITTEQLEEIASEINKAALAAGETVT